MTRTGGRILVDALRRQGVDRIFCVPGESYLPVLDALHDTPEIQVIVCRHEGAAANMAEADGKLTGRPGICFVTRGPGATHASVAPIAATARVTAIVAKDACSVTVDGRLHGLNRRHILAGIAD